MQHEIPPGFTKISGTRSPPKDGKRYFIHLRTGFTDTRVSYDINQIIWIHNGGPGDVVAVKEAE